MQQRLDEAMVQRRLARSRSQAANLIRLGKVRAAGRLATKPGQTVGPEQKIKLLGSAQYVSRAAYKLESVAKALQLDFLDKTVLDIGSSTGGFTQFALLKGAKRVTAVDVGTDQLHPDLRGDTRIELHEKTDIRDFLRQPVTADIVLMDLSFISLRQIIPLLAASLPASAVAVAMLKPQFEVGDSAKHKGVIKNDRLRRSILKDFETWLAPRAKVLAKADSAVSGQKGNLERFYVLRLLAKRS